ncbi:HLA class II histocompatibility antigen, DM alpha chain isoform X3 [Macrotis lagotis]|uniref:HLA class II histocompatibility antigen, DM alpha chain isoform X3 n=1 Tax=Macrotis lagotis TaxID=92651 RepID=UPI003D68B12C
MGPEQSLGATLLLLQLHSSLLLSLSLGDTPAEFTSLLENSLQNYTFSHTIFCQNAEPFVGLSESFNGDQLFSFDFPSNSRVPRLPEFAAWASDEGDVQAIDAEKNLCQNLQNAFSQACQGHIPESRAIDGLGFQAFSYLNFTPTSSDIFTCVVERDGDLFSTIAFWVPQNPIPSALLENILCGIAFGLGIVGIIVGAALIICFQKPCASGAD